jgi:hypothetical protein
MSLLEFLCQLGLESHLEQLVEHGYENLPFIASLTPSEQSAMATATGLKSGHLLRLQRALNVRHIMTNSFITHTHHLPIFPGSPA